MPSAFSYETDVSDEKGDALPLNVLPVELAQVVRDNERYKVRDLELAQPENKDKVLFTVTLTNLKNGQQTIGHVHKEGPELFYFQTGRGLMLLKTKAINVKPGMYVAVPTGVFHKVIASSNEDMLYLTVFQGPLGRPKEKVRYT